VLARRAARSAALLHGSHTQPTPLMQTAHARTHAAVPRAATSRELLAAGYKVRAAARDVEAAKASTDIALQFGLLEQGQISRLSWVEMDLEEPDSIPAALGNASRVRRLGCPWPALVCLASSCSTGVSAGACGVCVFFGGGCGTN
jgi:hypothetical protein